MSRRLALLAILAIAVPGVAIAATPRGGTAFENHKHNTPNHHDWHVQLEVNQASTRLGTLILYSQACNVTAFTTKVPLEDGSFTLEDAPVRGRPGATWTVKGHFDTPDIARGTWAIATKDCEDSGTFSAGDRSGHFLIGNPYEYPNARKMASGAPLPHRMRHLKNQSLKSAERFDTVPELEARGYVIQDPPKCPGFNHARKNGTRMWGKVLDPWHPQSLVLWCDEDVNWSLVAYMFRAAPSPKPDTYGRLVQWHKHGPTGTWMTHIWLVPDNRTAWATCAPMGALLAEKRVPEYLRYRPGAHSDNPCSDSPQPVN